MWSPRMVISLLLFLLVHTSQAAGNVRSGPRAKQQQQPVRVRFEPHYHDLALSTRIGPPSDIYEWQEDIEPLIMGGSFIVVVHGVSGSGKSRFIKGLLDLPDDIIAVDRPIMRKTRQYTVYDEISDEDKTRVLFVVDTPGFGDCTQQGQKMVADSLDEGIRKIRQTGAPIKRVLFMLDFARSRDQVPAKLKQHLQVLRLTYGSELAPHFRFVISKCDQLDYTKEEFTAFKAHLAELFKESFGVEMDPESVLFISTERTMVCYRHFTIDLNRAGAGDGFKLQYDRAAQSPYAQALLKFSERVKPIAAKYQHFHDSTESPYKESDQLKCDEMAQLSVDVSSVLKLGESIKDAQEKTDNFIAFLKRYIQAQEDWIGLDATSLLRFNVRCLFHSTGLAGLLNVAVPACYWCYKAQEEAASRYNELKKMAESDLASITDEYKAISALPTCTLSHFA